MATATDLDALDLSVRDAIIRAVRGSTDEDWPSFVIEIPGLIAAIRARDTVIETAKEALVAYRSVENYGDVGMVHFAMDHLEDALAGENVDRTSRKDRVVEAAKHARIIATALRTQKWINVQREQVEELITTLSEPLDALDATLPTREEGDADASE